MVVSVFSWLVCQRVPVWAPPDTLFNFFGQIQGQAPRKDRPKSHPPIPRYASIDGGMFFLPLRWTERIGSCRANAMVVPTGWFERLRYLNCQLV